MDFNSLMAKAKKYEETDRTSEKLQALIIGPSGHGKSHSIGTLGVKTLYLYFSGENHGKSAARKLGGENVIPYCLDYADIDGKGARSLSFDETYKNLLSILKQTSDVKASGFEAVALDGYTELEECILNTNELRSRCLSNNGKVDQFKTTPVLKSMLRGVFKAVLNLQREADVHFVSTMIADAKEYHSKTKEIVECVPRLNSFQVADDVLQQFGDYFIISPYINKEGEEIRIFDFCCDMSKTSKDLSGKIKKTINFKPRLSKGQIPEGGKIRADLSKLIEIKQKG